MALLKRELYRQVEGPEVTPRGSLAEIFVVLSATRWLRLYG
jgi:hypothetical protein